jgi:two-component system invasion response regulator UvrY
MRIMIIDDHALVRAGVRRLLSAMPDVDILEAANGREGLNILRSSRMNLIILDLNLPGLGGVELLRRIVQMDVGPVLMLSMHAEPIYIRRSLDAGAAGYATKNISPD